jgi:MFS family permease
LSTRSIANTGSSLLYIFAPNFPGFLTGKLLDDTGKAAFRPAWGSVLAELSETDRKKRAQTMAAMDTSVSLGEILGPIIAGALVTTFGIQIMFLIRIILAIITEIHALLIFKK